MVGSWWYWDPRGERKIPAPTGARPFVIVHRERTIAPPPAIDVDAYLKRIRYRGSRRPNLETLRALHLAHLHAVPLENLDVSLRQPTVLDLDRLFYKVVNQGRGGICHELNALFYGLLWGLGFDVQMLSGRVYGRGAVLGPELEHMLLKVNLDQRWIADVGFGETFHQPLLLDETGVQRDGARPFCLGRQKGHVILWARKPGRWWEQQYRFTLEPRSLEEYAAACEFRLSSPESFFSKNRICSMANPKGRVTILNDRLIITRKGRKHERRLRGDRDFREELSRHFGILLPDDSQIRFRGG